MSRRLNKGTKKGEKGGKGSRYEKRTSGRTRRMKRDGKRYKSPEIRKNRRRRRSSDGYDNRYKSRSRKRRSTKRKNGKRSRRRSRHSESSDSGGDYDVSSDSSSSGSYSDSNSSNEEDEEEGEESDYEERQFKIYSRGVDKKHLCIFDESIQKSLGKHRFDRAFMDRLSRDLRTFLNKNREIPEDVISELDDGVKTGELVIKIIHHKYSEWKDEFDDAKKKLDKEKVKNSPASEVLGVMKESKNIVLHLATGRFRKDKLAVTIEMKREESLYDSLLLEKFMESNQSLVEMIKADFPQVRKANLKVFEKMMLGNLQNYRNGALICLGDGVTLLTCCILMERPIPTNIRELNENTTHDFDSDTRSVRNYFLKRISAFSDEICGKAFNVIKKLWKLYFKKIYSSLGSMIERRIKNTLHKRWKSEEKRRILKNEVVNFAKFVVLQNLDIDKMLEERWKNFVKQYDMVPTTYAQTYEAIVDLGHLHFRIEGEYYNKMKDRYRRQKRKIRQLRRENRELRRRAAGSEEEEEEDSMSELSSDEEEREGEEERKRKKDEIVVEKSDDGVWKVTKGGKTVKTIYKCGSAAAGRYEKMGRDLFNFIDTHKGKYVPGMKMYIKPDRSTLEAGEYGELIDGKFHDIHGGWYDIVPEGPHPPLNFGDYHVPVLDDTNDVEEEEEEDDPVQLAMMMSLYNSFRSDGLDKHITGNLITEEELENFNKDLERVCHIMSVNLANQVYLFQSEMKSVFSPELFDKKMDFEFENLRKFLIKKLEEKSTVYYFNHMTLNELVNERFGLESELKKYQEDVSRLDRWMNKIQEVNNLVQKYVSQKNIEMEEAERNDSSEDYLPKSKEKNRLLYYNGSKKDEKVVGYKNKKRRRNNKSRKVVEKKQVDERRVLKDIPNITFDLQDEIDF